MKKLLEGVVKFRKENFQAHRDLFDRLKTSQKPHTLFIGCSDSRIVPSLITQTLPGELFIVRNIANIVPPYRVTSEYLATTSAIEYAVHSLKVKTIVVCGHSNCGGCALLYDNDVETKIPNTKKWLELGANVRKKVEERIPNNTMEEKAWLTEQTNILEQMKHLLTYPEIAEEYKKGNLEIWGWYYIINTGEVLQYNKISQEFELIN